MKIKITPQVFYTPCGYVRKFYIRLILDDFSIKEFSFDTREEVEAFLKGLEGSR